jgi:O-antigen/teichoic acid export membrane protein
MTAHRLTSRLGPPDEPVHRRGRVLRESHCRNTVVLAATTLSNAALGYGFWVVVTATAPAAQVGETTTVVSLMAAAALVADGGASTTAVQYMATATRQGERARFQRHLCSIVAAAAVLTSGGGLTIIGWMAGWRADLRTIVFAAVVTAAVTALALGRLADSMATADRNGGLVLRRNLWFATVKLILVGTLLIHENVMAVIVGSWAFASVSTTTVFLSRQLGGKRTIEGASSEVADSLPVSVLVRRTHHRRASRGQPGSPGHSAVRPTQLRKRKSSNSQSARVTSLPTLRASLVHHLGNIAGELPMYLLPVVVQQRSGATEAGAYFITSMVAVSFFTVSSSLSTSLFAELSHDPGRQSELIRRSTRVLAPTLTMVIVAVAVIGDNVLEFFGTAITDDAPLLLLILAFSAIPDAVTNLAVARWRAMGDGSRSAILSVFMGGGAVVLAWYLVPALGILGAGCAWLAAQLGGAVAVAVVQLRDRSADRDRHSRCSE